jgi:diguanylate cyclase (GGDEF)-like protein
MSIEPHDFRARAAATRRDLALILPLLIVFVGMAWIVRPLEQVLPAVDVALAGEVAETVLGLVLAIWCIRVVRRERRLAAAYEREIERLTESDALTGLGNARALARELDAVLNRARRTREAVTVVVAGVEGLGDVNRQHGRATGDHTLRTLGSVVRSSVRYGVDAGYRLEGDRFAIVLVAGRDEAQAVCRRLEWNFADRTPRHSGLRLGSATWDGRRSVSGLLDEARRAFDAQRQTAGVAQLA